MNKVVIKDKNSRRVYNRKELCNFTTVQHGRTAFVGAIGGYSGLFLITYKTIVFAEDPSTTWTLDCDCLIERFVDVEIREV